MDLNLLGKKVLITGSSKGIGYAIAKAFLNEGADVAIVSRRQKKLTEVERELKSEYGSDRVISQVCDCTEELPVKELHDYIMDTWGQIDVVVANVGDGRSVPDPLPAHDAWNKTWKSNFESALIVSRIFLPDLKISKGNLLFVSSITALEAFGAPVDYSTAKSAVTALAKNMARKLAKEIRVNVIAPGNVYFPGGSWDEKIKQDSKRVDEIIKATVPMARFGQPEEIADAVLFLCSERASFITGSVMVVDGGQTVRVF